MYTTHIYMVICSSMHKYIFIHTDMYILHPHPDIQLHFDN